MRLTRLKHTIFFVHFLDLPRVPATLDDIVVVLIPQSQSSNLGAGELCKRTEKQAIDSKGEVVSEQSTDGKGNAWKGNDIHVETSQGKSEARIPSRRQ